ncbi:MAG: excinuclease ABC subunit UvrB [Dehalococcoidia bacterium]|nr:excinuclease ABC subunit UvrB [Dehalococcoidia bacterium]
MSNNKFSIISDFKLMGDQNQAVTEITGALNNDVSAMTLLGATGTGKTFTIANVIENYQKPTLVLAPNRTLAAQLVAEFRDFFPSNAVEYFVSYYDYYQPEAYIPRTDTYIAKDADINDEIDKMRHAATRALFERQDVIIVASISCIYGLGEPGEYQSFVLNLFKGRHVNRTSLIRQLVEMQYTRNDMNTLRGTFRVRGDSLTIFPSYDDLAIRVDFFGDEIEKILTLDPLSGEILNEFEDTSIYPAKHFVTSKERLQEAILSIETELSVEAKKFQDRGKLLEAQRLEERTRYDIETIKETGYCSGIENYSRHLSGREPGSTPWTLLDYFPDDWLIVIDESHMSVPQARGMYEGDMSRKRTLVEHGFRLPSALDNRPLNFDEFQNRINQVVFVSATPGPYEFSVSSHIVQQVIRPTGILDPTVEVRPTSGQIDNLLSEINLRKKKNERCLITTLTKKMSEELNEYLQEMGIKSTYLHSEVDTLERIEILRDLRSGIYDVVVGINLLREGLDLPEVSLICILDADKEGYLRSSGALIQTIGRAARHPKGNIIMYADVVTKSMQTAIDETNRRRLIQDEHNQEHGITPQGIEKALRDINDDLRQTFAIDSEKDAISIVDIPKDEAIRVINDLENQMRKVAKELDFERAAILRDQIVDLRRDLSDSDSLQGLSLLSSMRKDTKQSSKRSRV